MRNLKRLVFALILTGAAITVTSFPDKAYGDTCHWGMTYCECPGIFVGCAFDCFAACE